MEMAKTVRLLTAFGYLEIPTLGPPRVCNNSSDLVGSAYPGLFIRTARVTRLAPYPQVRSNKSEALHRGRYLFKAVKVDLYISHL